ncbi:MAG: hypothetical protein JWR63_3675, partial [Conexibacter sp.]|nr:hypothetical protein [Conexibacter sp.]
MSHDVTGTAAALRLLGVLAATGALAGGLVGAVAAG